MHIPAETAAFIAKAARTEYARWPGGLMNATVGCRNWDAKLCHQAPVKPRRVKGNTTIYEHLTAAA